MVEPGEGFIFAQDAIEIRLNDARGIEVFLGLVGHVIFSDWG
jgi:hypothetical protein